MKLSEVEVSPLIDNPNSFDIELALFFEWLHEGDHSKFGGYENSVFNKTAMPMVEAWWCYKEGMVNEAINIAEDIQASDWRKACVEWLERKKVTQERHEDYMKRRLDDTRIVIKKKRQAI